MRISISYITKLCSVLLILVGFSSQAAAQTLFSDNFEDRITNQKYVEHGWTWYEQTFDGTACTGANAGYGPYDENPFESVLVQNRNYWTASNDVGQGDSYFRAGLEVPAWGGSLSNMLRVYGNKYNEAQGCVRVLVFQEMTIEASGTGTFKFTFDVAKDQYGAPANGEATDAFVKVISPTNGWATLLDLSIASTPPSADATTASRSIEFTLPAELALTDLLQFGFYSDVAIGLGQSWATSGAYYDNVELAPVVLIPPPQPPDNAHYEGVPIPLWALFGIIALLAVIGGSKLRSREKA